MALEHQNITLGEATAALSAAVAQNTLRDALLDHASGAWTLEEEFDSGGGIIHWVVVKNATAISGAGTDFYVCIGRKISDGMMGMMVGETYIAAANQLSKYAPLSNSQAVILADDTFGFPVAGPANPTWTLNDTWPDTFHSYPIFNANASAATERVFTSVDADYAILNFNGQSYYVGALTDLIVPKTGLVATPAIACCSIMQGNPGYFGAVTRHPVAAADAPMTVYWPHGLAPIVPSSGIVTVAMELQAIINGLYGYADRYQNDRVAASEVAAVMLAAGQSFSPNNNAAKVGAVRAKFKGLRWTTGPKAAVAYDDIIVDNKKHVVVYPVGALSSWNPYVYIPLPYNYDVVAQPMLVMDTGIAA